MRVLIWVQHLLGTGHLHRAFAIGRALAARGFDVTIASGGPPDVGAPDGIRLVQLPPVRAADLAFSALVDDAGDPVGASFWAHRRERLLALFHESTPHALVTEMFPFGRRAFRHELLPLLQAALDAGVPRLASVRDVLVEKPDPEPTIWMLDFANRFYTRVLVHTDPQLVPFGLTFPHAAALGDRLVTTGYLGPPATPRAEASGEVLVSAGGGRVGRELIHCAARARRASARQDVPWRLIAGAGLPEDDFRSISRSVGAGLTIERHRDDFQDLLAASLLSVSQAGYNTVVEALTFGKPMVLVPFETASETEQRVRAARLEALGLAEVVPANRLNPARLAVAIDRALDTPPRPMPSIDLGGVGRTAGIVEGLIVR